MGLIKTSEHILIVELARKIAKSTCKLYIYQPGKIRVPQSHGTLVLFEFNDNYYCVSNAHVLADENFGKAFVINSAAKSMTISGQFYSTKLPVNGKREDDVFDISIVKLADDAVKWLKDSGYVFLSINNIKTGFIPSKEDALLIVGYPASKTKTNTQSRSIITSPLYFFTSPNLKDLSNFNFSKDYHVIVNYQRKKILNPRTTKIETGPLPYGMSGGGVWYIQKNKNSKYDAFLVGIMFEYLLKKSSIVSTKIDLFIDIIKKKIDPTIPNHGIRVSIVE